MSRLIRILYSLRGFNFLFTQKRILIYLCRCNERLQVKTEGSTRLTYVGLSGGLEHLKDETRLDLSCEENDEQ